MSDFFTNLQAVTSNIEDITFSRFATITSITGCYATVKEDEEDGLTHENVPTLSHNLQVGDKVVLGFVDNRIYNPVILGSMNNISDSYTKEELDGFVNCLINRLDTGDDEGGGGDVVGFDVDINMVFSGVSGRDDSITLSANLIYVEE